jgi:hypothetical protein
MQDLRQNRPFVSGSSAQPQVVMHRAVLVAATSAAFVLNAMTALVFRPSPCDRLYGMAGTAHLAEYRIRRITGSFAVLPVSPVDPSFGLVGLPHCAVPARPCISESAIAYRE